MKTSQVQVEIKDDIEIRVGGTVTENGLIETPLGRKERSRRIMYLTMSVRIPRKLKVLV